MITFDPAAVVILSGGMDSTVLLASLIESGRKITALTFFYGQRHMKEIHYAGRIASYYRADHEVLDIAGIRSALRGSSQTDSTIPVPHGHYTDASMKWTVVPNRNMIMLSVAAAYALSQGIEQVFFAAHAGDHPIYPDCRPEFVEALNGALLLCHEKPVSVVAPFLKLSKGEIVELGARLGAPFGMTWSCYEGKEHHCGKCGTCVERREAFQNARVEDPTVYGYD